MTATPALTPRMRAALFDRYRVSTVTARALERRGLATVRTLVTNCTVLLTDAGYTARDEIIAPFIPGTRVRNVLTDYLGTVIRIDQTAHHDMVVLRWDYWQADTCGSPAFLEVVKNEPADDVEAAPAPAREPMTEVYNPFWVRTLVEQVGRELHDMDMLAKPDGDDSSYARGHRSAWESAAQYLERSTRQAVARLGLTQLLEATRAGLGSAERAAIPQGIPFVESLEG